MKTAQEKERKAPFIGFWHYGVILTYLSAVSGVVGIFLSATVGPFWGVVCLLLCGLCDAFKGMVAGTRKNRSERERKFGEQVGSLSDLIAFGVAPIAIGFFAGMNKWYFMIPLCIFTLCALIRLAHYNVVGEERIVSDGDERKSSEGLPLSGVAIGIPVFYVIAALFKDPLVSSVVLMCGYLLAAFLLVFRFRMPKAGPAKLAVAVLFFAAVSVSLVLIRTYVRGVPFTSWDNVQYTVILGGSFLLAVLSAFRFKGKDAGGEVRIGFLGFWNYGVVLTYLSACAGLVCICLSLTGHPLSGCICLFVSALCDSFDGMVAGTRKNRSAADHQYGEMIDSMSDTVAFVVAPAALGYALGLNRLFYLPVLCVFVVCGVARLGYYNVTEEERIAMGGGKRTSFEGLPVAIDVIVLPFFYLLLSLFRQPPIFMEIAFTVIYAILAFLFVFRFRMPKANTAGLIVTSLLTAVAVVTLFLIGRFALGISWKL